MFTHITFCTNLLHRDSTLVVKVKRLSLVSIGDDSMGKTSSFHGA